MILQSHWSLSHFDNRPKKFDLAHLTIDTWSGHKRDTWSGHKTGLDTRETRGLGTRETHGLDTRETHGLGTRETHGLGTRLAITPEQQQPTVPKIPNELLNFSVYFFMAGFKGYNHMTISQSIVNNSEINVI